MLARRLFSFTRAKLTCDFCSRALDGAFAKRAWFGVLAIGAILVIVFPSVRPDIFHGIAFGAVEGELVVELELLVGGPGAVN